MSEEYSDLKMESDEMMEIVREREKQMRDYERVMGNVQQKIVGLVEYMKQKEKGVGGIAKRELIKEVDGLVKVDSVKDDYDWLMKEVEEQRKEMESRVDERMEKYGDRVRVGGSVIKLAMLLKDRQMMSEYISIDRKIIDGQQQSNIIVDYESIMKMVMDQGWTNRMGLDRIKSYYQYQNRYANNNGIINNIVNINKVHINDAIQRVVVDQDGIMHDIDQKVDQIEVDMGQLQMQTNGSDLMNRLNRLRKLEQIRQKQKEVMEDIKDIKNKIEDGLDSVKYDIKQQVIERQKEKGVLGLSDIVDKVVDDMDRQLHQDKEQMEKNEQIEMEDRIKREMERGQSLFNNSNIFNNRLFMKPQQKYDIGSSREDRLRKQQEERDRKKQQQEEDRQRVYEQQQQRQQKYKEEQERQKQKKEQENMIRKQKQEEERRHREEQERVRKQKQEEDRQRAYEQQQQRQQKYMEEQEKQRQRKEQENMIRKQKQEEERRQKEEQERIRRQRQEEDRRQTEEQKLKRQKEEQERKQADEQRLKKQKEEQERRQADEQRLKKQRQEEERKNREEQERIRRQRQEEEHKQTQEQKLKRQKEEQERRQADEQRLKKQKEEQERKQAEEQRLKKQKQEEERKNREEQERIRKQKQEEERKQAEEQKLKRQKEEQERRQADEQRLKKQKEEQQRKQAEEERIRKQKQEEEHKRKEEEEKTRKQKQEDERKRKEEEERLRKQKQEEERKRKEEEERIRKQKQEEERKQREEQERIRKQKQEEERKQAEEQRLKKQREEQERKRKEEEERLKKQREEQQRKQEEERKRKEEEEKIRKQKQEDERKRKEEEERLRKQKQEDERKRKEEEERIRKQKQEEERKRKEQEERLKKQKEEQERLRKEEEERMRKESDEYQDDFEFEEIDDIEEDIYPSNNNNKKDKGEFDELDDMIDEMDKINKKNDYDFELDEDIDIEDDDDMDKDKGDGNQEDDQIMPDYIISDQNIEQINKYINKTKFKQKHYDLEEYNNIDSFYFLFEEQVHQKKAFFLDFDHSLAFIQLQEAFMEQCGQMGPEEALQSIEEDLMTLEQGIKETYYHQMKELEFLESCRIFLPFPRDNKFNLLMMELNPYASSNMLYFQTVDPELDEQMMDELESLMVILAQIFGNENYQNMNIQMSQQQLNIIEQHGQYEHVRVLIVLFSILYDQDLPTFLQDYDTRLNQNTVQRLYSVAQSCKDTFQLLEADFDSIENFYVEYLEQYQSNHDFDIIINSYPQEPDFQELLLKIKEDIQMVFDQVVPSKKQVLVCLQLRFEQDDEEIVTNYYLYFSKQGTKIKMQFYLFDAFQDINQYLIQIVAAFKKDNHDFQFFYDFARHNIVYEQATLTIGTIIKLHEQSSLPIQEAIAQVTYSLVPYIIEFENSQ